MPAESGHPERSFLNVVIETPPLRVGSLDKLKFPCPAPFLEVFLARDRRRHRFVELEVNETVHPIAVREPVKCFGPVRPNPLGNVAGYADIQRAVPFTCKNVDAWSHLVVPAALVARFRGHDTFGNNGLHARSPLVEIVQRFSDKVVSALGCYVYRLIDPRNGATFYVGRGRGNRVFAHAAESLSLFENAEDADLKFGTIRARSGMLGLRCSTSFTDTGWMKGRPSRSKLR